MRKTAITVLLVLLFGTSLLYASPGDLVVTGNVSMGSYTVTGPSALAGAISGLTISNDATYPNTKINVTASSIGMIIPPGTIGIDCTQSGIAAGNDLDTGTLAANTWYYLWAIYNGTAVAGLASTSSTSPAMPGNYTNASKRLIGIARTDTSAHFVVFAQQGMHWIYDSLQTVSNGTTAQNWTVQNCATFIPPKSTRGCFQVYLSSDAAVAIVASLRKNGSSSTVGHRMGNAGASGLYAVVNDWVDTDPSQFVQLSISAAVGNGGWYLRIVGFELNL